MSYYPAVGFYFSLSFSDDTSNSETSFKEVSGLTMEMETESIDRLKRENKKNFNFSMTSIRLWETKRFIELLLQGFVLISLLFYGGHLVANRTLSAPELLSFFTGCGLLIDPIIAFSSGFTSIKEAEVSTNRIYQLLDVISSIFCSKDSNLDKSLFVWLDRFIINL